MPNHKLSQNTYPEKIHQEVQ